VVPIKKLGPTSNAEEANKVTNERKRGLRGQTKKLAYIILQRGNGKDV